MRQHPLTFACLALAAVHARAHAQSAIAAGFERFELADVTATLRDDTFSTIAADPVESATAYVGTHHGRIYKTTDGGRVWTESTIIPEQRLLWATPGSSLFFGAIRSSGGNAGPVDLIGARTSPIAFPYLPGQLARLPGPAAPRDALASESAVAAGGGGATLGVGLSERSPRLSILVASRGRAVPTLSRIKFLVDRTLRGTTIFNIAVDPSDRRLLFAATQNGLYKSFDGGDSWSRVFAGATSAERTTVRIALRPGEPSLAILGTANGAYTSADKGDSWSKSSSVGGVVSDVGFDRTDARYVYLATSGGVMRSTDGGVSFAPIYYSTFPAEADVRSIVIDPFDPETAYIGTMRGALVTHKLRTATIDDWEPLAGVQSILAVPIVAACARHKGHIYALTRVDLHSINYGADTPESAILESWDGGRSWRQLFTGRSDGRAESFALDVKDPDQLWIGWTTALHRLLRTTAEVAPSRGGDVEREGPPLGQLVLATLRHHDLELDEYADHAKRGVLGRLLPSVLTVTATMRQWSAGGILDDAQFAAARYLQIADAREWEVMAWASWRLPDFVYSPSSVPMIRQRVQHVNDEIRSRLTQSVRRNYGELTRLKALLASTALDLKTRVIYQLRVEQLEALVDLTSGGYLTRWENRQERRR